jgi:hypothetical protein
MALRVQQHLSPARKSAGPAPMIKDQLIQRGKKLHGAQERIVRLKQDIKQYQ